MNANAADWTQIEPLLDDAMHALDDTDRIAVLLRFFHKKSLREVGRTLGMTDDTARKCVNRAIERLCEFFAKCGVTVGASGLVIVITANAVKAAPVGLVLRISAAALGGTTIAAATATKAIAMTPAQNILIATVLAVVSTGICEAHHASRARVLAKELQKQQVELNEQIHQLPHERDDATPRLATLPGDAAPPPRNTSELLKLRGEVSRVTAAATDPAPLAAQAWMRRINELRQYFGATPGSENSEFQFVSEDDWQGMTVNAYATHTYVPDDEAYRRALVSLRNIHGYTSIQFNQYKSKQTFIAQ